MRLIRWPPLGREGLCPIGSRPPQPIFGYFLSRLAIKPLCLLWLVSLFLTWFFRLLFWSRSPLILAFFFINRTWLGPYWFLTHRLLLKFALISVVHFDTFLVDFFGPLIFGFFSPWLGRQIGWNFFGWK